MTRKDYTLLVAFILLIIVILLSACTDKATRHLRKADKHLKKAIAAGAKIKADTTWHTVPLITPEIEWQFDTKLFPNWQTHRLDSIRFKDEETGIEATASIELKEGCPEDCIERLRLAGKIPRDTIYVEVPVYVSQEISCPPKDNKWKWIAIGFGAVLILSRLFWK